MGAVKATSLLTLMTTQDRMCASAKNTRPATIRELNWRTTKRAAARAAASRFAAARGFESSFVAMIAIAALGPQEAARSRRASALFLGLQQSELFLALEDASNRDELWGRQRKKGESLNNKNKAGRACRSTVGLG